MQTFPCWFPQKVIGAGGMAVVWLDPCCEFGFVGVVDDWLEGVDGWFEGFEGLDGFEGFDGFDGFCWLGEVPASVFTVVNPISVLIWTMVASTVVDPFKIAWMWTGNKQ